MQPIRTALGATVLVAVATFTAPAAAERSPVYGDGRDRYTLLDQHLQNRQLFLQLDQDDQSFRLGRSWERVRAATDFAIGLQGTPAGDEKSRFHGYYLANGYFAVRLVDGLEANLNLLLFNPSASDGYRQSSEFAAGLALHAYGNVGDVEGDPVRIDVFGTDLDQVTLGAGLLVEHVRLEGLRAGVSWRDLRLDALVGGRAFWSDDDLYAGTLSAFDGLAELRVVGWDRKLKRQSDPYEVQPTEPELADSQEPIITSYYLGGSVDVPIFEKFRIAAEYDARLREPIRNAFLGRADYLDRDLEPFAVHAGYQFRWYQDRFGPRDAMISPTTQFTVPYQEDMYVTNSFEYFGISEYFEQWSHTLMLEGRARLGPYFELYLETELWLRYAKNRAGKDLVVYTPTGFRAPGRRLSGFYRGGVSAYPWPRFPHRANLFLTNKQVLSGQDESGFFISDRIGNTRRYDPGTYLLLELEAFL